MKKLTLLILSIILVSPLLAQAESSNNSGKWLIYTDFIDGSTKYKKDIDSNSDPVKISDSEFEKLSGSENRTLYSQDKKIKVIVDDQNIYINDKIFIKNDRNYKPHLITSDNKYLIYSYFVDGSDSVYIKNLNEGIDKKGVYIGTTTPSCVNVKDNAFYYNAGGMESGKVYKEKYSDILNTKVSGEDILGFDIIIPAVFSSDCKTLIYSDLNGVIYKKGVNKTDKAVAMKNSKGVTLKGYLNSLYDSSLKQEEIKPVLPDNIKVAVDYKINSIRIDGIIDVGGQINFINKVQKNIDKLLQRNISQKNKDILGELKDYLAKKLYEIQNTELNLDSVFELSK